MKYPVTLSQAHAVGLACAKTRRSDLTSTDTVPRECTTVCMIWIRLLTTASLQFETWTQKCNDKTDKKAHNRTFSIDIPYPRKKTNTPSLRRKPAAWTWYAVSRECPRPAWNPQASSGWQAQTNSRRTTVSWALSVMNARKWSAGKCVCKRVCIKSDLQNFVNFFCSFQNTQCSIQYSVLLYNSCCCTRRVYVVATVMFQHTAYPAAEPRQPRPMIVAPGRSTH